MGYKATFRIRGSEGYGAKYVYIYIERERDYMGMCMDTGKEHGNYNFGFRVLGYYPNSGESNGKAT